MIEQTGVMRFAANGGEAGGYLALPQGQPNRAGIVVIQEWWGLNPHIEEVARRFAAAGYVALAPDLYDGQATTEPDEARKLAMGLDMQHAATIMVGAVNYLCGRDDVDRVGSIGFCMGGSLSQLLASRTPRLSAAVSFYGGSPITAEQAGQIGCPLLAIFGGRDPSIPAQQIEETRTLLEHAGVQIEVAIYPDAGHAFFNDTRPEAYSAEAAADAWQRTLRFFDQHLRAV